MFLRAICGTKPITTPTWQSSGRAKSGAPLNLNVKLDSDGFRLEFQANFFTPAFFAAFCKSSSSVASGMPNLKAYSWWITPAIPA
jgi:hypothetical protein